MSTLDETYQLSNGVEIPKLGLGTWFIPDQDAAQAVREATRIGYRHLDTAQAYRNEAGVGEGLRTCGVPREQLFLTTKLAAEVKAYDAAVRAIDGSLEALQLEVIDLMLIHSPQPWSRFGEAERFFEGNREAWRALEDAYKAGKLRSIGVSNFERVDLENLFASCTVRPMVNQIRVHIGHTPTTLIRYTREQGLLVEAYSPIAHGELLKSDEVKRVAARYGVSVPQLSIRYALQLGLLPLPKSANPAHMKSNAEVDFEIVDEDMTRLVALPERAHADDSDAPPSPA